MTPNDTTTAYLRSKVMTASPEELRLMLLDGALRFAHQARNGLETGNHEQGYLGFSQCRAIVMELMTSVNDTAGADLAEKVRGLYAFLFSELVHASFEKDIARLDKVIELLGFERETWSMLMDKLASERAAGAPDARQAGQPRAISLRA